MIVREFLASPAGLAVQLALTAAFLDWATGAFRAWRDGRFALDSVAAFVRKHLAGRVAPLTVLAVAGWLSADAAINTAAALGLTAYYAETMGSIYAALRIPNSSHVPQD